MCRFALLRHAERPIDRLRRGHRNRPKVAAYRAPGAPIAAFARRKRDGRAGAQAGHGPDRAAREERGEERHQDRTTGRPIANIGYRGDAGRRRKPTRITRRRWARTRAAASPRASGSTSAASPSAAVHVNEDGTVVVVIGQSRHRRLARLDRHDGGRGAGRAGREVVRPIVARYRLDRLHHPDRRQPRDLRHRHGCDPGGREGGRASSRRAPRRSGTSRSMRWSGRTAQALPAGSNAGAFEPLSLAAIALKSGADRRADQRRGVAERAGRRAGLRHAYLRRRGRPGDRPRHHPALHRGAGRRQGDPSRATSRARSRAAPRRASAGR